METISNMAHTAAKAVWGDGTEHDEPASGVQGDVSKGEPYDGGNIDPKDEERRDSKLTTAEGESVKETQDTKKHTGTVSPTAEPSEPAEPAESTTTHEPSNDSVQKGDEKSLQADEGPRPLATIAKENGGDAGNIQVESEPASASATAKGDATVGHTDDKSPESKGTGEKYVKTTGLAADGGDFDATNPGAGREADRLMERKGVDRQGGVDHPKPDSSSSGSGSKDGKPSLKEKIKDKLHIHKS